MFYWSLKLSSFADLYVLYRHLYVYAYMYRTDVCTVHVLPQG